MIEFFTELRGDKDVIVRAYNYEHSPDIGISSFEYVCAWVVWNQGQEIELVLTEEEEKTLLIEANEIYWDRL